MIARDHARLAAASLGPIGHLRPASGTWGSLPPVLVCAGLWALGLTPASPLWPGVCFLLAAAFSAACLAGADAAEARWGTDPSPVVADEAAGQSLTLAALCLPSILLPSAPATPTFVSALTAFLPLDVLAPPIAAPLAAACWPALQLTAAFLLFRLADILKPWPANALQDIPGGWGILLDDLAAALQAAAVLALGLVCLTFFASPA